MFSYLQYDPYPPVQCPEMALSQYRVDRVGPEALTHGLAQGDGTSMELKHPRLKTKFLAFGFCHVKFDSYCMVVTAVIKVIIF